MSINPTVKHKSMFKHKAKSVPKIRYGLYLTVLKVLEKSHDLIYLLPATPASHYNLSQIRGSKGTNG